MMNVQRYDLSSLQDFRSPSKVVAMMTEPLAETIETPPPPPAPTFSESEMNSAKKNAFEEGRQAGISEGLAQANTLEAQRNAAIESCVKQLVHTAIDVSVRHQALLKLQCEELFQLVLVVGRKVAGDAMNAVPHAAVETMIAECLGMLVRQPKIILTIHPDIQPIISQRLQYALDEADAECELVLHGDSSMEKSEGKLEWQDGLAERKLDRLWQQIEMKLRDIDFCAMAEIASTAAMPAEIITTNNNQEINENANDEGEVL